MLVQQSKLSSPMLVQPSMLNGPMLVQQSERSVAGDAWIGESLYDKLWAHNLLIVETSDERIKDSTQAYIIKTRSPYM
jgi:hypothetical protein